MPGPFDDLYELSAGDENSSVGRDKARAAEEAAKRAYRQDVAVRQIGGTAEGIDFRSTEEQLSQQGYLNNARRARGLPENDLGKIALSLEIRKQVQPDGPASTVGGAAAAGAHKGGLNLRGLLQMLQAPVSPVTMEDAAASFQGAEVAGETDDSFLLETISGLTGAAVELVPTLLGGGIAGKVGKEAGLAFVGRQAIQGAAAKQLVNKIAQRSALAGVSTSAGIQNASPEYYRLIRDGVPAGEAFKIAASKGLVTAAVTSLFGLTGAEALLNPVTREASRSAWREIAKQAGLEIAEEEVDLILNNFVDVAAGRPSMTFADFLEASGQTAIISGILGGGVTGLNRAGQKISQKLVDRQQEKMLKMQEQAAEEQRIASGLPELGVAPAEPAIQPLSAVPPAISQETQLPAFDPESTLPPAAELEGEAPPVSPAEFADQQQMESAFEEPAPDAGLPAPKGPAPLATLGTPAIPAPVEPAPVVDTGLPTGEDLAPVEGQPAPLAPLATEPAETAGPAVPPLESITEPITPESQSVFEGDVKPVHVITEALNGTSLEALETDIDQLELSAQRGRLNVEKLGESILGKQAGVLENAAIREAVAKDPVRFVQELKQELNKQKRTTAKGSALPALAQPAAVAQSKQLQKSKPETASVVPQATLPPLAQTRPFISPKEIQARAISPRAAQTADQVIQARLLNNPAAEAEAVQKMKLLSPPEQEAAGTIVEEQQAAIDRDPSGNTAKRLTETNTLLASGVAVAGVAAASETDIAQNVVDSVPDVATSSAIDTSADAMQGAAGTLDDAEAMVELAGDAPILAATVTGIMLLSDTAKKVAFKIIQPFIKPLTWFPSIHVSSIMKRIGRQGGEVGKNLEAKMRKYVDAARENDGKLYTLLTRYKLAAAGHSDSEHFMKRQLDNLVTSTSLAGAAPDVRELARIEYTKTPEGKVLVGVGTSLFSDAVEGRYKGTLKKVQQRIVNGYKALFEATGKMAEDTGLEIRDSETGKMLPFIRKRDGALLLRRLHPDAMARLQNGDALFLEALVEAIISVNPELEGAKGEIEAALTKDLKAISEKSVNLLSAMETMRNFKVFPAGIQMRKQNGGVESIPILLTDPFTAGTSMASTTAMRMAHIEVFGQDTQETDILKLPWAKEYIDEVTALKGNVNAARRDVLTAARIMHGLPAYNSDTMGMYNPSNKIAFNAQRILLGAVSSVGAALTLSNTFVVNVPEPVASGAIVGNRSYLKAFKDLVSGKLIDESGLLTGTPGTEINGAAAIISLLAEAGAISVEIPNIAGISVRRQLETIVSKITRGIGNVTLVRPINELLERSSALAGYHFVSNMKLGRGSVTQNMMRLITMGVPTDKATRMSQGKGTDAEYRGILSQMPSFLQGANANMLEQSTTQNSKYFQAFFKFWSFSTQKSRQTAGIATATSELFKIASETDNKRDAAKIRAVAVLEGTKFLGQNVIAGTSAIILKKITQSGILFPTLMAYWVSSMFEEGPDGEESREQLQQLVSDGAWYALVGAPRDAMWQAAVNEHNAVGFDPLGAIGNMSYTVSLYTEAARLLYSTEKYANKSPAEKAMTYFNTFTPGAKYMQRRMGVSAVLFMNDTMETRARRAFFGWFFKNKSKLAEEGKGLFRKSQIAGGTVYNTLQRRAREMILANAPVDQIALTLKEAAGAKYEASLERGEFDETFASSEAKVRQFLLGQRLLESRGLNLQDKADLRSLVGPSIYADIAAHDLLITTVADAIFPK